MTHQHITLDDLFDCQLDCADLLAAPKYWVLMPGGYPTVENDYTTAYSDQDSLDILEEARPFMADPTILIFDGSRCPWIEHDPYPDYVALYENGNATINTA